MVNWNRLSHLKISDINQNSTRWDHASAAPSDDILKIQFTCLAIINFIVATSCFLLLLSILRVPKVREKSFNCYLLTITFPDFISSSMCFITCAMSSVTSTYYSEIMCGYQTFYLVWGFTSNCWMNAVIAYQIHTMLSVSHVRGRYDPPTRKRVGVESLVVYAYAFVLAGVATWHIPGVPFKGGDYGGLACFPKSYDNASTFFFWFAFVPLFMLIPLAYVLWSCGHILYKGMVPPVGRRRNLALYFFRLIFVFVFMWLPFIIITFVVNPAIPGPQNPWVLWAGAAWSHLQGLVSVVVSCTKADIKDCLVGTVTCDHYLKKRREVSNNRQQTNITSVETDRDHHENYPAEDGDFAALRSYSIMRSFNNFSGAISDIGSSIISGRRSSSTMTASDIRMHDINMASIRFEGMGVNPVAEEEEEVDDFREDKTLQQEDIDQIEKQEQSTDIIDDSNKSTLDVSETLRKEGI